MTPDEFAHVINIENMLKFAFTVFQVHNPLEPFAKPKTLLECYITAIENARIPKTAGPSLAEAHLGAVGE